MHVLFLCEGSCWAFSTVGAVEGLNKIVTGDLVTLSEQDLINCNKESNGCEGGKVETAYEFIINNGGLSTEKDYPYKAVNGVCDWRLKVNIYSYNNTYIEMMSLQKQEVSIILF